MGTFQQIEKPLEECSDGYPAFCPLRGEPEGTCTDSIANARSLSDGDG